ncbi:chromosome segregation protein SMC [Lachnoclostridium sp. Marseille-P6806]|uniref:chromosome segregation protein SMC n=1 Tax=Lachnoclostridium sp. Marseille-P6806 TaxID=2364793 RepID=UPI00103041FA|nr:chromosome segregation protein SMC [Lachnoclostridium sp. Marseille-P6806]
MYLKSIEIHGFKSFANKINFQFHNGITAIVGPNGSGKSNVADAVRWVLGEQRVKQLRGANMQDVIFSGTEARRPMGYAYVAITLDNADRSLDIDYAEVTVARRLYRSGESEYLINGTVCRLKDIAELFYDTGIGKEGYSIIGQGQIERILSDKPEDRRELFDEAAGIVKFKRRKELTQKKLESEQSNLVRVNDILSEIEHQIGPLERQAEKARVYLKARERQKQLDINVFLLENSDFRRRFGENEKALGIASGDLEKAQEELAQIAAEYDAVQTELEELERTIGEKRDEVAHAGIIREQLQGNINVYEEQIRSARRNLEQFRSRGEQLEEDLKRIRAEREAILGGKNITGEQIARLEAAREEVRSRLQLVEERIAAAETETEESKSRILESMEERSNIRSRLSSITTQEEQLAVRRAELTGRLVSARTDESRQDEVIAEAEKHFEEISAAVAELGRRRSSIDEELGGMKARLAALDESFRSAQIGFHQNEAKLETLKNMTERYDGFGQSVRRVMENKSRERGLLGVVADLLKTDEKYETAIEVALGGSIQNVVTEDESTVRRMIDFLNREKAGRVTFLPLTEIGHAPEFRQTEVLREPGVIGLADSLIHCEERYRVVAKSLLGRIVVADSYDHASAVSRKYRHSYRVVSLRGDQFNIGGSISGGSFRNNSSLLSRRREIAELEKKIAEGRRTAQEAQNAILALKERRNTLREELARTAAALSAGQIEQNTARLAVIREKDRREETAGSVDQMKEEDRSIREQAEELKSERAVLDERLEEALRFEEETNLRITEIQKERDGLRSEEETLGGNVAERDLEISRIRQTADFQQQNLDRLDEEARRYGDDLREVREHLSASGEEISRREKDIADIRDTIAASHAAETAAQQLLADSTARRGELSGRQKDFFDRRSLFSDRITALEKECYRLNTQRERLQEAVDSQINYLWDEYQITPSDAEALRDETLTELSPMRKEIAAIRQQIRELGNVNVGAIEEFRETSERYTFLKTQHDDLIRAAETLRQIIAELDDSMRKQFREQFAKINHQFDIVFRELFGGGHGSLELVEDTDILEAGVRVIAQPPGKKLVNMMQMSGGEKSLTAISLLFAIQNLKPSPFCLLDEIEAALDESNVGRFADYLHKLTKGTQFIVITHRRGTMDRADRLYGITMQEKGVSALVSVNLIDKDLTN